MSGCWKRTYDTRAEALRELDRIRRNQESLPHRKERSTYLCNVCQKWHLSKRKPDGAHHFGHDLYPLYGVTSGGAPVE